MPLNVIFQKTANKDFFEGEKIAIHGLPGTGKSTFASSIPGAIFLDVENGLNKLDNIARFSSSVDKIVDYTTHGKRYERANPKDGKIYGWAHLVQTIIDLTKADKDDNVTTIVLDSVDFAFDMCKDYVRLKLMSDEKNSFEHESDLPYGKGWDLVKREFMEMIQRLFSLPYGIVLIFHSVTRTITLPYKGEIEKVDFDIRPSVAKAISAMCSAILYLTLDDNGERTLLSDQTHTYNAKCRIPGFPKSLNIEGKSAYKEIMKALRGEPVDEVKKQKRVEKEAVQQAEQAYNEGVNEIYDSKDTGSWDTLEDAPEEDEPELPGVGVDGFDEALEQQEKQEKEEKTNMAKILDNTILKLKADHKQSDEKIERIKTNAKIPNKDRYSQKDKKLIINAIEEHFLDAMYPNMKYSDKTRFELLHEIYKRMDIPYQLTQKKLVALLGENYVSADYKKLKAFINTLEPVEFYTGGGN